MNDPNAWKRGLRRRSPGVYVDGHGRTHIDSAEYLTAHGFELTLENEELLFRAMRNTFPRFEEVDEAKDKPQ
jgi:hypothetical protein